MHNIIHLGVSMCLENLAMRVGFVATAVLAARLGTDEFAAHNVGMSILGLAGIWLGVLSDQSSRFFLMGRRFRQGKWVDLVI